MELIDVKELGMRLGVPRSQVYRLAAGGKLEPAYRVGKYWRFQWPDVLRSLESDIEDAAMNGAEPVQAG